MERTTEERLAALEAEIELLRNALRIQQEWNARAANSIQRLFGELNAQSIGLSELLDWSGLNK